MLETILVAVVLVAVLGLLVWAAGYMLVNGSALDWFWFGNSLCKAIGVVFALLVQVISNGIDS